MKSCLLRANLNFYLRHPWQLAMSILGIVLGIAVVVSIDLARVSSEYALARSTEVIAGRATHRIIGGPGGIDEAFYTELRVKHGFENIAPIIQGFVVVRGAERSSTLQLLGIDVFADGNFRALEFNGDEQDGFEGEVISGLLGIKNSVLMDRETARSLGTRPGDELQVEVGRERAQLYLLQYLGSESAQSNAAMRNVLVSDIASAQEILGMQGRLSHIDLVIDDGNEMARLEQLQDLLPPGTEITRAEARQQAMTQMTGAFHTNLTALSLLALLVGMFLIYNTMTFMVLKRRENLGVLRSIGVTRQQIFQLVLLEALIIGSIAIVIGIPLGNQLGKILLLFISRSINDLFYMMPDAELVLSPLTWFKGIALGLLATTLAALVPAMEAARVTPREAMSRRDIEARSHRWIPWLVLIGLLLLGLGALILLFSAKSIVAGFAGIFVVILGCVSLVPLGTLLFMKLLSLPLAFYPAGWLQMSLRSVQARMSRTAVAVSALVIAFATVIGISLMIHSFRGSVELWLDSLLRADIYVSTPGPVSAGRHYDLDRALAQGIADLEDVSAISTVQFASIESGDGFTNLAAYEFTDEAWQGFRFKHEPVEDLRQLFEEKEYIIVSETYAWHREVGIGDDIELRTDRGMHLFKVAGIYYDYRYEQGLVAMSRLTYNRYWDDHSYSGIGVYLQPGVDRQRVLEQIQRVTPGEALWVEDRQSIYERSLLVFDQTFTITGVLRILAAIIAFLGLFSALMALQLERTREFAIYRAIGFLPRQLAGMIVSESTLLGLVAGLLAIPVGCLVCYLLVVVINRRSFGWSMELAFEPVLMLQGLLLALLAAVMAGLYPALRIARSPVATALRSE